jgi:hypothetical protein
MRSRNINFRFVPPSASMQRARKLTLEQLEAVQSGLQADPDSAELQDLKTELEQVISLTEASIAELKPSSVPAAVPKKPEPAVKEKWSRENHPAFKKNSSTPVPEEADTPTKFSVNDTVLAKWHSGDKGFYPARITSITGSSRVTIQQRHYGPRISNPLSTQTSAKLMEHQSQHLYLHHLQQQMLFLLQQILIPSSHSKQSENQARLVMVL